MSIPVSGEQHERAVEAAGRAFAAQSSLGRDRYPEYVAMVTARTGPAIDAYHRSLAEQGCRLIDLREVMEWLRDEDSGPSVLAGYAHRKGADAIERRFGPRDTR